MDFWANWLEAVRFTCEAQGVMSVRLMLFASGAPDAASEAERMIAEKITAFANAHAAAERAYQPLKRCVSANGNRLGVALH